MPAQLRCLLVLSGVLCLAATTRADTGGASRGAGQGSKSAVVKADQANTQVILYSTSWCGFCERARQYFQSKNIAFIDKDIESEPGAATEMKRKCAQSGVRAEGVPVIDVYGTMISGFDVPRIDAALSGR